MADNEQYAVVIIGAGPAACSAATFLARANLRTLFIGNPSQSGLADAARVENLVGFPDGISGPELLERMREQAVNHGATFLQGEVTHIEKKDKQFLVRTAAREEFTADRLVLAHGANFIKVDLPGEKELVGKGIHYCALCDGPLYKNKNVLVLGNSNLAAEEAIQLAGMGAKVQIVTHALEPNIAPAYQGLLAEQGISVSVGRAERFDPGIQVALKTKEGGKTEAVHGVFIALGVASSMVFAQKLGLELNGNFLKADEHGRTNIAGVWVAGLARGGVNQVAKSVGEGAVVAVDIIKAVKNLPQYLDHT